MAMTAAGDVLSGRYRLVDKIATGGMGLVWEAWDELLLRRVAVKQLLTQPGLSDDEVALARSRVIREARLAARLHHPHAVTLYDVVDHDGHPCLIMEFVRSVSLSSLLRENGTLAIPAVNRIGADLASALVAAHAVGIVHRDVKPGNVLITDNGSAKLTDFGISHAAGDITLTATGMVSGTPAFLAPEVARGAESGYPADVFSLGSTLYAALEGSPPFGSDANPMAMLHRVGSGRIEPPSHSGRLTPLLLQMLAPEPSARPTMEQVAHALTGHPIEVRTLQDVPPTAVVFPQTVRESLPEPVPAETDALVALGLLAPQEGRQPGDAAPIDQTGRRRRARGLVFAVLAVLAAALAVTGFLLIRSDDTPSASIAATSQPELTSDPVASSRVSLTVESSAPTGTTGGSVAPQSAAASTPKTVRSTASAPAEASPAATPTTTVPELPVPKTISSAPDPTTVESVEQQSTRASESTADDLASAINDYYAVMPANTDTGWALLTPNFQSGIAQNRDYYDSFWGRVDRVTVSDISGYPPETAEATITYYFNDGTVSVERTSYRLVSVGGSLKIDDSEVVSSDE